MSGERNLCLLLLLLALSTAAAAAPDEVTVESTVDRTEITIGDFITYTVLIVQPAGVELLGDPLVADLQPFEVVDAWTASDEEEDGTTQVKNTYRISVYETGEHTLPPYSVRYMTPEGEEHQVQSGEHVITVRSVLQDADTAEDIRDLKDPLVLGLPFWRRFGSWLLAAVALLILLVILIGLRRRLRRHPKAPKPAPPPLPAHVIAYEALTVLRKDEEGLLRRKDYEHFSVRASNIIREYLLNRYGLLALDRTTEEILEALDRLGLAKATEKGFQEFLEDCDLVKFARETLERSDMLYLIDLAWRLVDETRERELETTSQKPEANHPRDSEA